jgi:hypothetical protein
MASPSSLSQTGVSFLLTPAKKLLSWYTRRNPIELWLELLRNAEVFEDWEEAALHLDNLLGLDLWYVTINQPSRYTSSH